MSDKAECPAVEEWVRMMSLFEAERYAECEAYTARLRDFYIAILGAPPPPVQQETSSVPLTEAMIRSMVLEAKRARYARQFHLAEVRRRAAAACAFLGLLAVRQEKFSEAADHYRQALTFEPGSDEYRMALENILRQEKPN